MFHVILHEPEIPPNTGNIIRLCANTGCTLHLVGPLGFELSARALRRAGLDYHDMTRVCVHPSLAACLAALAALAAGGATPMSATSAPARLWVVETGAPRRYSDARFVAGDALLFGSETRGLPAEALQLARDAGAGEISIPMLPGNRSLNLSNAVALVVYEAWRQLGFAAP